MKLYGESGIYFILCGINKKMYIGSSGNMGKRISWHMVSLKSGAHPNKGLQKDYTLYSPDVFTWGTTEKCSKDTLEERETYWVDFHKTLDEEHGYNKMMVDRSYLKSTGCTSGVKPLKVINIYTGDVVDYVSISDCRRGLKFKEGMIRRALKYWDTRISDSEKLGNEKKRTVIKTYKNLIFIYADQYDPEFDYIGFERIRKGRSDKGKYRVENPRLSTGHTWQTRTFGRKEVVVTNIATGERDLYNSVVEATTILGLKSNRVHKVLSGDRNSYAGYRFEYTGKQERTIAFTE